MNLRYSLQQFSYLLCFLFIAGFCSETKICVAIVVKDDETTISQCLKSIVGVADCISVCDAGSTDGTLKIVEEFFQSTGIPGKIYKRSVQNGSYAHLIAAEAAKRTLTTYHFNLGKSYLLLLEPDQILSLKAPLTETLVEPAYFVLERSWSLSCSNYIPRLFRASVSIEDIQFDAKKRSLKKVRSFDIEEAFPLKQIEVEESLETYREEVKKERLNQYIERYREALQNEPHNPSFLFFVAHAHKGLKQHNQAIEWYKKVIEIGTEREDVWFAKYMIGECSEEMGLWIDALYWYLEAYQHDSNRSESLLKIATHYRVHGQTDLAYLFAKHGLQIPKSEDILRFSSEPLRDYRFDEEISVSAFYTRFKEDGYEASNDLLLRRDIPYHIREQGYRNLLFYVQNIKARFLPIEIPLPPIHPGSTETYYPMNPSILKTGEGYKLICRSVNYTQLGAKHFTTNDPEGVFRTRNYLVHYDRFFNRVGQHEILDQPGRAHCRDYIVQGLEDCRIFRFGQEEWFSCSTFDTNPTGAVQISVCKMKDEGMDVPVEVEKFIPLKGPDPNRHEKNWLPFVKNNELFFLYSSDPFTIYKPNLDTGDCSPVVVYTPFYDFSQFRGSAPPIEFDGGYLMMVHEVVLDSKDYTRYYIHRLVFLDQNFNVKKVSRPFTFNHLGVEYCLSITVDHEGNQLIIPIGIEDRQAFLAFVDLNEIRNMLKPLPTIYNPY